MSTVINVTDTAIDSRRRFLKSASGLTLTALALGTITAPAGWAAETSGSESGDVQILNVALGLEHEAIAAYALAAKSGLLTPGVLKVALEFQGQHKAHADVLASTVHKLGGHAVVAKSIKAYHFPVSGLNNQADVLRFAAGLEHAAATAYLGAVPQFHNRALSKAAASIMGDETMHWAILRNALGENPVPMAFIG